MKKVQELKFENVGLLSGNYEVNGKHVIVMGANQNGKTTLVKALERICNKAMPSDIITKGKGDASAKITFDDGTVIDWSKATGEDEKIIIEYADGLRDTKPTNKLLQQLIGKSFDLNRDFLGLQPKPRKEFVAKISGVDLERYDSMEKAAEENRRFVKNNRDQAKARIEGIDTALATSEPVDVYKLQQELNTIQEVDSKQKREKDGLEALKREAEAKTESVKEMNSEIERLLERIEAIKLKVKEAKKENGDLLTRISKGEALIAQHKDYTAQKETLSERISKSSRLNTDIELAKKSLGDYNQYKALEIEADEAEDKVSAVRSARIEAIKSAKFPAGLSMTENGQDLLFTDNQGNLIALDGANEAQKTIIGLQIGLNFLGEFAVMACDLSHLDKGNRETVFTWADANDVQLFAERVTDENGLTVELK